jgi:hypothetical protein
MIRNIRTNFNRMGVVEMSEITNEWVQTSKQSIERSHACARKTCQAKCPLAQRCQGDPLKKREKTVFLASNR